ncbi:hypothetical protein LX32DRAFT_733159 [Colletotrichum zoysiae]|uniref:Uncharacterized protein n=1 Tax=Colletotrichum zoysiae TaxID=1216348 RepID=A0AAD9H3S4_9PEZI|nr:hypothetical protein LX32DRAFT_733159 [Colletotrichum zoysiae]
MSGVIAAHNTGVFKNRLLPSAAKEYIDAGAVTVDPNLNLQGVTLGGLHGSHVEIDVTGGEVKYEIRGGEVVDLDVARYLLHHFFNTLPTSKNMEKPQFDEDDPLLRAFNAALRLKKGESPRGILDTLFGSATKTYNLAALLPWSDITDLEGAEYVASKTIEAITKRDSKGFAILDPAAPAGTVTIVANCERGLNGRTDDQNKLLSRSRAHPVDAKVFSLVCDRVHAEVRKPAYAGQLVIVSLAACIFYSNEAGEQLQGIHGTVRASDEQRVWSNRSENVWTVQLCDLRSDAQDNMGGYSYHEFDLPRSKPSPRPPPSPEHNYGRPVALLFADDDDDDLATTVDGRSVLPPGTTQAHYIGMHRPGRGTTSHVPNLVVAHFPGDNAGDATATQVMTLDHPNNPLDLLLLGDTTQLALDADFVARYPDFDTAAESVVTASRLLWVSEPGSYDGIIAASILALAGFNIDAFADYLALTPNHIDDAFVALSRDVPLPREGTDMAIGGEDADGNPAVRQASLLESTVPANRAEADAVNHYIARLQTEVGARATNGPAEVLAETINLRQEATVRHGDPITEPLVENYLARTRQAAQRILQNPDRFQNVPVHPDRVEASLAGNFAPVAADDGNGGVVDPGRRVDLHGGATRTERLDLLREMIDEGNRRLEEIERRLSGRHSGGGQD